ncbi:FAXDC2 isoform 7 [Pan troglodytes]|uniref:Fatty acid hydroxylase domain containing 2 n=3 Tax=Hominidae TaxID=9604 RepID=E5RFJ7_HUMAN|nr:fatty acid hydroxylase domain containing 2 [Homo sapiens]KAI4023619.1 fatty acid hydroxylase domain containing 2 [Homo sapiens]PNI72124.1 FAXDC2 isoform 7 [Pan troglodytes]PNJ77655.1 FAXDC2 isoform 7 [Pongo abelii]
MRRTAFILGSGLLSFVAFWNSVTWHLQRFWGASGYFWQAQWERLLTTFEGKEWILFFIGGSCETAPVYPHSSFQPVHDIFPHGGLPLSLPQMVERPLPP